MIRFMKWCFRTVKSMIQWFFDGLVGFHRNLLRLIVDYPKQMTWFVEILLVLFFFLLVYAFTRKSKSAPAAASKPPANNPPPAPPPAPSATWQVDWKSMRHAAVVLVLAVVIIGVLLSG